MNTTYRHVPSDPKSRPAVSRHNGISRIHGYAAVYNVPSDVLCDPDRGPFKEKISPGAFDRVLSGRPDVRALVNHDPNHLLGRTKSGTLSVRSDSIGLHYLVQLGNSPLHDHWAEVIDRGDMDGSSFSFGVNPGDDSWDFSTSPPTRTVNRVRALHDVGPVVFPAYPASTAGARQTIGHAESRRVALQRQRMRFLTLKYPWLRGVAKNAPNNLRARLLLDYPHLAGC